MCNAKFILWLLIVSTVLVLTALGTSGININNNNNNNNNEQSTRIITIDDGGNAGRLAIQTPWRTHFCYLRSLPEEQINIIKNEYVSSDPEQRIPNAYDLKGTPSWEHTETWNKTKHIFYLMSNETATWNLLIMIATRSEFNDLLVDQECFTLRYTKSSAVTANLMSKLDKIQLGDKKKQLNAADIELALCHSQNDVKSSQIRIANTLNFVVASVDILLILVCAILSLFLYQTSKEHRVELQQCMLKRAKNNSN